MIWLIVTIILGLIIIPFISSFNKDNTDLQNQTVDHKFEFVVSTINDAAFNGTGTIATNNKREFYLYKEGANQIINFIYGTGDLTIIWKYKYFQKELVHKKHFNNVRNLSVFEQQKIANEMINEMVVVVQKHKLSVLGGI